MRIVIAPQSLKGSLTAAEAGLAIAQGARTVYPEADIAIVPMADRERCRHWSMQLAAE